MSKRLTNDEKTTILTLSAKGESVNEIGRKLKRSCSTVSRFIADMQDTSKLAEATLKAGAIKLVERIIKKADVKESIDVLSRTNIGVLAPATNGRGSGIGGIELSVMASSCGTVVQVKAGGETGGLLERAKEAIEGEVVAR